MSVARVVILGGGFGGMTVARALARRRFRNYVAVTIIDRHDDATYTPWLHEVAGLTGNGRVPEDVEIPLARVRGVRFRKGSISGIDTSLRHIFLEDGSTVPYDVCVVALGTVPNAFGISGFDAFTIPLNTANDAQRIREEFSRLLSGSHRAPKRMLIIGSGANGTELAAECAATLRARPPQKAPSITVTLAGMSHAPLAFLPSRLQHMTEKRLHRLGVVVRSDVSLSKIEQGTAYFQPVVDGIPKGERIVEAFDCCVTSIGVKVPDVIGHFGFLSDERGRVRVDQHLRVLREQAVFGIGDCVCVDGARDPQTAVVAIEQGKIVAKNILALLKNERMTIYRGKKVWDSVITIGPNFGVGMILGFPCSGYTMSILRRLIDAQYLFSVLPMHLAIRHVIHGVFPYAKSKKVQHHHVVRT